MINQLLAGITIPKMSKITQQFDAGDVGDAGLRLRDAFRHSQLLRRIAPDDRVAIAVGSRGLAELPAIVSATVEAVRSAGGKPFIVPAMGSHGGANAEGQADLLHHLGIDEAAVGAPIRSSMEVVRTGELSSGLPLYTDRLAAEADKVIVINRIKPHTSYRGAVESGLMKMLVIGLGKQKGAESLHGSGLSGMAERIQEAAAVLLGRLPVIFGVATLENAYDRVARIDLVPGEQFADVEPRLLIEAKSLMPAIPFDPIDVLVVDEIGKNISGTGMDPNITGRFTTSLLVGKPSVSKLVVLGLTKQSQGNPYGIGLADITTRRFADEMDSEKAYANAITSTITKSAMIPMIMPTGELAVKAAVKTCGVQHPDRIRMIRIHNTLDLQHLWISPALLAEARDNPKLAVSGPFEDMTWA